MRRGLVTRVDRIAARIAKRSTSYPMILCTLFDTDDSDIVGVACGADQLARHEGETVDAMLERVRTSTGIVMWSAVYDESIGGCIGG